MCIIHALIVHTFGKRESRMFHFFPICNHLAKNRSLRERRTKNGRCKNLNNRCTICHTRSHGSTTITPIFQVVIASHDQLHYNYTLFLLRREKTFVHNLYHLPFTIGFSIAFYTLLRETASEGSINILKAQVFRNQTPDNYIIIAKMLTD